MAGRPGTPNGGFNGARLRTPGRTDSDLPGDHGVGLLQWGPAENAGKDEHNWRSLLKRLMLQWGPAENAGKDVIEHVA